MPIQYVEVERGLYQHNILYRKEMKVVVIFDFPEIKDANSSDADFVIDSLSSDLKRFGNEGEYDWYIDNVTGN